MKYSKSRRFAWLSAGSLIMILTALGMTGLALWSRLVTARDATVKMQQALRTNDPQTACTAIQAAAQAWQQAALIVQPLQPAFQRLGFIPGVGGDLVALPDVVELARHGTAAGQITCAFALPAWEGTTLSARLALAARAIGTHPREVTAIVAHAQHAERALDLLMPKLGRSTQLKPYHAQLQRLQAVLPTVVSGLQSVQQLGPELPWLLGIDQPRTYLVALQNPFEVRATGGFIGLICVLQVAEARPALENCQSSDAYDVPAPTERKMPAPYERYLRLGGWYLRDANWSPDFPTTAQTLQWFWELNKQPAADGVVAIDLYALPVLVETLGFSLSEDGQPLRADQAVDEFMDRYYSQVRYRDKAGVGEMLPSVFERSVPVDMQDLPRYAHALQTLIAERHLMISVNNAAVADWLAVGNWDGGFRNDRAHTLRIVEADVGYGGVNAFIERLTHYDVDLGNGGTPLTATLTMTFTNRYSPWAEFSTAQAVYGNCTDPRTLQLERLPGCYAPYVRVYAPAGSRLIEQRGLEEAYAADERYNRAVFGGYLRLNPGEQRTLQFRYRLPSLVDDGFVFEKQAGTTALPILFTVQADGQHVAVWSRARTDLEFVIARPANEIVVTGSNDPTAIEPFTSNIAFTNGLAQWQSGDRSRALETWRSGAAGSLVIDHARLLVTREQKAEALELLAAVAPIDNDGRAMFEQAVLLEMQGDETAADVLFRAAALRNRTHPLAVFQWQRRLFATGQVPTPLLPSQWSASAVRHWRELMYVVQGSRSPNETLPYMQVLLQLTPSDRSLMLNVAMYMVRVGRADQAREQLDMLTRTDDLWGRLARAHRAGLLEQPTEAITHYQQALELADTYRVAYDVADWIRELGSRVEADQADQRAATMLPKGINTLIEEGNEVRSRDARSAHRWYERAQRLDATNPTPAYLRGNLFYEQGMLAEAQSFLQAAVDRAPDNVEYKARLAQVTQELHRSTTPH